MRRHAKNLSRAKKIAKANPYYWKHGCVIAKGNRIVSSAPNKKRNIAANCPDHASVHAEVAAIRDIPFKGA